MILGTLLIGEEMYRDDSLMLDYIYVIYVKHIFCT